MDRRPREVETCVRKFRYYVFSGLETFGNVTLEAGMWSSVVVDKYCSGHLVEDGMTGFGGSLDEIPTTMRCVATTLVNFRTNRSSRTSKIHDLWPEPLRCDVTKLHLRNSEQKTQ